MRSLVYPLSQKAYHRLSDDHLWFSIFSRPLAIHFARVQQCIYCFVLLFTVMLLNILYYQYEDTSNQVTSSRIFSIGPFHFTKEQIIIGIIIDVLIFIPSTLLVTLFRRVRQRQTTDHISVVLEMILKTSINQAFVTDTETSTCQGNHRSNKTKGTFLFPWWCLFIAYGFSYLLIGVSILIIIARSIEFGDAKIQKWLASLTIKFLSSVHLSQSVKVSFDDREQEDETKDFIDESEDFYLNGARSDNKQLRFIKSNVLTVNESQARVRHLSKTKVARARRNRLREIRVWSSF
ncbi:unnamed protein product [Adineta ricciae]|uniref:Uncharacterized protein n=1 Tax=Adineta ricciae TaxID=249248 RepID=A0A815QCL6_ADIRI|nr:unnamed protein product [Adineta ricciae]CAF1461297.1 unnamed protein product [Adineta ricciae]